MNVVHCSTLGRLDIISQPCLKMHTDNSMLISILKLSQSAYQNSFRQVLFKMEWHNSVVREHSENIFKSCSIMMT